MALRQSHSGLVAHQIAVIVFRHAEPQGSKQKNLPGSRFQQVRSAHYFCNLHGSVVNHDRELICRHIVPAPNDEVPEIPASDDMLRPEMQIGKSYFFAIRNPKSPVEPDRLRTSGDGRPAHAKPSGSGISRPANPRIHRLIVPVIRRPSRLCHISPRAGAGIDHPQIAQLLPRRQIARPPLALRIRAERSAAVCPLCPFNPQPVKIVIHRLHKFRTATLRIQIFIAKDQLAVAFAGALRRDPKRARMPQVQKPGWRGRYSPAVRKDMVSWVPHRLILGNCQTKWVRNRIGSRVLDV